MHMGVVRCGVALRIEIQATNDANDRFRNRDVDEWERNQWNAYHHAIWMARMIQAGFTFEEAMTLGLAHEMDAQDPGSNYGSFESRVDMHNDWVGAQLGMRAKENGVDPETYVLLAMQPNCAATVGLCLNMRGH